MADLIHRLFVRLGRRQRTRDFVSDCCHRIEGRLRAGPPTTHSRGRS